MKTNPFSFIAIRLVACVVAVSVAGCAEFNDPYGPPRSDPYYGGYNNNGYGYDRRDDYYRRKEWERDQRNEERRLDREREQLERERRRLEKEKEAARHQPPSRPPAFQDRCPPGFSPSENKCSDKERKRGCKDIRMPSGLGCVHR